MTDEKLRCLRGINFRKAYKCHDCGKKFDSIIEYNLHHLSDHKEMQRNFDEVIDDSVINHCSICQKNFSDSDQFVDHFVKHVWNCHQCERVKGLDVKAMIMHSMQMHENDRKFKDALLSKFGKTKVIYGNGLVLYKCHLTGTKVDDLFKLKKMISTYESVKHFAETRVHHQMQTFQPQPGPSLLPPINYYPIGTHPGCHPAANYLSYHSVGANFDPRNQSFHPQSTSSNRGVQLVQTSTIPTKQPYQPDSTSSNCINNPTIHFPHRKRPLQPEPSHSVKLTPEKKHKNCKRKRVFFQAFVF